MALPITAMQPKPTEEFIKEFHGDQIVNVKVEVKAEPSGHHHKHPHHKKDCCAQCCVSCGECFKSLMNCFSFIAKPSIK